jgi:hypothetical protein
MDSHETGYEADKKAPLAGRGFFHGDGYQDILPG